MSQYTAIGIFHFPDGVLLPGETADLDDDVASRGIEAGLLGPAQIEEAPASEPAPPAPEAVETQE